MAKVNTGTFTIFLITKTGGKGNQPLINIFREISDEIRGKLLLNKGRKEIATVSIDADFSDVSKCDIAFVDTTDADDETFYLLGIAHALGKPVVTIASSTVPPRSFFASGVTMQYSLEAGESFKTSIKKFIKDYQTYPQKFRFFFPYIKKAPEPAYIVDLDRLQSRDFENLCFELISQMGFKKVNWGTEIKDIDLIATLTKKDPDGFEYQELWLIVTGNKAPTEHTIEMALMDPEYLVNRIQKVFDGSDFLHKARVGSRTDIPITLLFVINQPDNQDFIERRLEKAESFFRHRKYPFNVRIRSWNQSHLTKLIQSYPQIAFKYFSDQSGMRSRSKYRKSTEELYDENIKLTEEVLHSKALIEEEKRKRFIAERETAWKDVAFKAAHKLGNPVDATDTYLQSLKRKLESKDIHKALDIADLMDNTIEEAKAVIGQFKSLTKIEEINAKSTDLISIIKNCSQSAKEQGIDVDIEVLGKVRTAFVDPTRIAEVFSELVANSMHWFDKTERRIKIIIKKADKEDIPEPLDSEKAYLKITYEDNGCGVPMENKEKIFSPFYSTYQHGTGLGLSITKKVIELQGGWIIENGQAKEGACFQIFLPININQKSK